MAAGAMLFSSVRNGRGLKDSTCHRHHLYRVFLVWRLFMVSLSPCSVQNPEHHYGHILGIAADIVQLAVNCVGLLTVLAAEME